MSPDLGISTRELTRIRANPAQTHRPGSSPKWASPDEADGRVSTENLDSCGVNPTSPPDLFSSPTLLNKPGYNPGGGVGRAHHCIILEVVELGKIPGWEWSEGFSSLHASQSDCEITPLRPSKTFLKTPFVGRLGRQ